MNRFAFRLIAPVFASAILVACGGGGGTDASLPASMTTFRGTASAGTPLGGASILVVDGQGKSFTGTADAAGEFRIDASSAQLPALVFASGDLGGSSVTYAGVATGADASGSVRLNVTPLTDAVLSQALGRSASYYKDGASGLPSLNANELAQIAGRLTTALAPVLESLKAGSSNGFDPLATAFSANGQDPYDKVMDLVNVFVSKGADSGLVVNLANRTDDSGVVSLQRTGTVTALPALSQGLADLPIDRLSTTLSRLSELASTSDGLNSTEFAALFDADYRNNGVNKDTRLAAFRNSSGPAYFLGFKLSKPQFLGCDAASKVCRVSLLSETPSGGSSTLESRFKYDTGSRNWVLMGNGQDDLMINFQSYGRMENAGQTFKFGAAFGVRDTAKSSRYKSASVEVLDRNDQPSGTVIQFREKVGCPVTANNYIGLPLANAENCESWVDLSDADGIAFIAEINQRIRQGGVKLRAKAYTSTDWSGSPAAQAVQPLTAPLVHPSDITASMFPDITIGKDSQGPFIRINNAADFNLNGSVCLSSATDVDYCDMSKVRADTSEYRPGTPGVPQALQYVYRPKVAWAGNPDVRSFFVNARDKLGRALFRSN